MLSVAEHHSGGPQWDVSADGYIPYEIENLPKVSANVDFKLFRNPQPHITIIVPNGYRGLIKVAWHDVPKTAPEEIGKRQFTFRPSPNGLIHITATPLLRTLREAKYLAGFYDGIDEGIECVYEDGTLLQHNYCNEFNSWPEDSVPRWCLIYYNSDSNHSLYFVGTNKEAAVVIEDIFGSIVQRDQVYNLPKFEELFNGPSPEPTATTRP